MSIPRTTAFNAYLFLIPLLSLLTLFYVVPVLVTFPISLTELDRSMTWELTGFDGYGRLLRLEDPLLPKILANSAIFLISALVLTMGLGLLIALVAMGLDRRAGIALRTIWILPRATPPVVWAFLWVWSFDPTEYGLVNALLASIGLEPQRWLSQHPLRIVILANALMGVPYVVTVLSAALEAIPKTYAEAAKIDGAGTWQIARSIYLPLLRWPLAFLTIWHALAFLTSFQYTLLITDGGPFYASETLSLYIYHRAFAFMEFGYGARLALALAAVSFALVLIAWRVVGLGRMMTPPGGAQ